MLHLNSNPMSVVLIWGSLCPRATCRNGHPLCSHDMALPGSNEQRIFENTNDGINKAGLNTENLSDGRYGGECMFAKGCSAVLLPLGESPRKQGPHKLS